MFDRPGDAQLELVEIQGLLDEIVGAPPHRPDRRLDRAVGGHHQHAGPRVALPRSGQHRDAVGPRQSQVGEDHVVGIDARVANPLHGGVARRQILDVAPGLAQREDDAAPQRVVVLDDEDARVAGAHASPPAAARAASRRGLRDARSSISPPPTGRRTRKVAPSPSAPSISMTPAVARHDLLRGGEPDPRAVLLGGEEGVEDLLPQLGGNSRPRVGDADHELPLGDLVGGRGVPVGIHAHGAQVPVRDDALQGHGEARSAARVTAGHGLECVDDQIRHDRAELLRVRGDLGQVGAEDALDRAFEANAGARRGDRGLDQRDGIQRTPLEGDRAARTPGSR